MEDERYHPKNWRPNLIAFSGSAGQRVRMAELGHWLASSRGILTLGQVISGDFDDLVQRRNAQERVLSKFMSEHELAGFPAVVVAATRNEGIAALVQCHGVSAFRCNAALFGWSDDPERASDLLHSLQSAQRLGRSVLLYRDTDVDRPAWDVPRGTIDVWWRGKENGPLMAMLAHLLTQNEAWSQNELRILRVLHSEDGRAEAEAHLIRLAAEATDQGDGSSLRGRERDRGMIHEESKDAALVVLGMLIPEGADAETFITQWAPILEGLDTVLLVNSAGDVALDV